MRTPGKGRQRRNVGDIAEIKLPDGRFAYAWLLNAPLMGFFDAALEEPVDDLATLVTRPLAFRIWVMDKAITTGTWPIVGHVDPPAEVLEPPRFYKLDRLTGKLTVVTSGAEKGVRIDASETAGLECAAVWDPDHVVSRLDDQFHGRPNKWLESMKPPVDGRRDT